MADTVYFKGAQSPLSNMFTFKFKFHDHEFHSTQQAYQYVKASLCGSHPGVLDAILWASDAYSAKKAAQHVRLTPYWNQNKVAVMEEILLAKYEQCVEYRQALDSGNSFAEDTLDNFWGRGRDNIGENHLGRLHHYVKSIMKVGQQEERSEEQPIMSPKQEKLSEEQGIMSAKQEKRSEEQPITSPKQED